MGKKSGRKIKPEEYPWLMGPMGTELHSGKAFIGQLNAQKTEVPSPAVSLIRTV